MNPFRTRIQQGFLSNPKSRITHCALVTELVARVVHVFLFDTLSLESALCRKQASRRAVWTSANGKWSSDGTRATIADKASASMVSIVGMLGPRAPPLCAWSAHTVALCLVRPHANMIAEDDFMYSVFQSMESKSLERNDKVILKNLVEPFQFEIAKYNRVTSDMDEEEKSERLFRMLSTHETQTMICKKNIYRQSRRVVEQQLGREPPWYTLFDGCHRKDLTDQFLAGKCYVKIHNPTDSCDYFCWNTQEAVDAITEYKEYHLVLSDELRERLLKCPISMIYLDPKMSDTDAYHRARIANKCNPLWNAQIMKCMCSKNTIMAKLLSDMNTNDRLWSFLEDDLYRYNVSLIRMFVENSFDATFAPHIAMLQSKNAIERAEELINDDEKPHDDIFVSKVLDATNKARSLVNAMIEDREDTLRKNHMQQSAIGLIYLALVLACANANESALDTTNYLCRECVSHIFDVYTNLNKSEKGDNHKRIYVYFTTGVFPEAPVKSKKRKATADEEEE